MLYYRSWRQDHGCTLFQDRGKNALTNIFNFRDNTSTKRPFFQYSPQLIFKAAIGGQGFTLTDLNDHENWINAFLNLMKENGFPVAI